MSIEARLPDGTVLRFPEGTSDEVIQRTVRQQLGVQAPPSVGSTVDGLPVRASHEVNASALPARSPNVPQRGPAFLPAGDPNRTVDDVATQISLTPIGGTSLPQYSRATGSVTAAAPWTRQVGESPLRGAVTAVPQLVDAVTGLASGAVNAGVGGVASLFGAEAPVLDFSTNLTGLTNRGFDAAASAIGLTPTRPDQRTTALYGAGSGAGAAATGAGVMRGVATRLAPRERTTTLGNMAEGMLNNYRYAPGRTLAADVGAGAGAGAAAEMARDAGAGVLGTVGAALVGGTALGSSMGSIYDISTAGGRAALDRLMPNRINPPSGTLFYNDPVTGVRQPVRPSDIRTAAGVLQSAVPMSTTPGAVADTIESRARALTDAGFVPPTTGALSEEAGPVLLERARRNMPGSAPEFIQRDQQVQSSIARNLQAEEGARYAGRAPAERAFQQAADAQIRPAEQAVDAAQTRVTAAEGNVRAAENAAQRQRDAINPVPRPDAAVPTRTEASERLDDILVNQTLRPAQETRSRLYNEINQVAGDLPVNTSIVQGQLQDLRNQVGALRGTGAVIDQQLAARLDALAESGTPLRVRDLVDILPDLSRLRASARNAGQYTLADNIDAMRGAVREALEGAADLGPDAARAIQATFDFENNTFALFRRGEIGALRDDLNAAPRLPDGTLDRNAVPPSDTINRFWATQKGAAEKAADLESFIAASPDPAGATEAIRNYVTADLAARVAGGTGQVSPAIVARMLTDYNDAGLFRGPAGQQAQQFLVQMHDDLMRSQNTLGEARAFLNQTVEQLKQARENLVGVRQAIDEGPLRLVLGADPKNAAASVFASPNPVVAMRQLTDIAKAHSPEAWRAWRNSVSRHLYESVMSGNLSKTGAGQPAPVRFADYIATFTKNEEVLEQVMGPAQMNTLRTAINVMRPMQNLAMTGIPGSQTAQNQTMLRVAEIGLKSVYGGLKGGNMFRNMKLGLASMGWNTESAAVSQIIQRSFFDPELAAYLYRSNPDMPVSGHTAQLRRYFAIVEGNETAQQE